MTVEVEGMIEQVPKLIREISEWEKRYLEMHTDLESQIAKLKEERDEFRQAFLNKEKHLQMRLDEIAKLKEEVRQGKFRLADEQDSHSHVECNEVIAKLKDRINSLTDSGCDLLCEKEKYRTEVAKLKEESKSKKRYLDETWLKVDHLKSTLDEIKKPVDRFFNDTMKGSGDFPTHIDIFTEFREILAKHEGKK